MASEYIRCPHCGNRIQKTPLFQVLSEMNEADGKVPVGGPATEPCVVCRKPIDRQKIADGEYDVPKKEEGGCLGYLVFAVIITLICAYCGH